jgi:signal transduction histidine kinase
VSVERALLLDSARVQQILTNLVANAIKFTPSGGTVHMDVRTDEGDVVMSVRDTGIGITPDFLPHVFERFRQAESGVSRPFGGLGIGLSIVRQLAERHGGRVTAESEGENRGATFTVRIPAVPAARIDSDVAPLRWEASGEKREVKSEK